LDEPFSALDASLRAETRSAVAKALQDAGATGILVTHDQSEALSMGHQVGVLWDGHLEQIDTPQSIYRSPATPALAQFLGDAVLLEGTSENGRILCTLGSLAALPGIPRGRVQVLLRPEQIRLLPSALAQANTPGLRIEAQTTGVTFNGHDALVRLQLLASGLHLCARVPGHMAPVVGTTVLIAIEGAASAFPV